MTLIRYKVFYLLPRFLHGANALLSLEALFPLTGQAALHFVCDKDRSFMTKNREVEIDLIGDPARGTNSYTKSAKVAYLSTNKIALIKSCVVKF